MIRRHWRVAVIVLCLAGSAALGLLAVELVRWQRQIAHGDAFFPVTPRRQDLWQVHGAPSWDPAKAILGIDHELSYRRALQLAWIAKPVSLYAVTQQVPADRAAAESALGAVADSDPDPAHRAEALNLLGVHQLYANKAPQEPAAFRNYVKDAIADFANAVQLGGDPDAKLNLELALGLLKNGYQAFFGHGPIGGKGNGTSAGVGVPGSGY